MCLDLLSYPLHYSVEHTSGVVVDVGHGIATFCVVWEGKELPGSITEDPVMCSAPVVAEKVHSLVIACSDEMKAVLWDRVVVTGKMFI